MTLQQMKYVVEIADRGSMNEAARALFISQPSLSGAIRELENEIGITLFTRSNRGIQITAGGMEFLGYARQTLEQYRLMKELDAYPCISFDQGTHNSFYYAEEVLSTYPYHRRIRANDRATVLNMMIALNGYTLCSGIICEELNGDDCIAVPLDVEEVMHIGYITRSDTVLGTIGQTYIEEMKKFGENAL